MLVFSINGHAKNVRSLLISEGSVGFLQNPKFKERVAEEYLNERSHFRETGVKTKR